MADGSAGNGSPASGIAGTVAAVALLAIAAAAPSPATVAVQAHGPLTPAPVAGPATTKSGVLGKIDLWQQRNRVTSYAVGVIKKFTDDRAGQQAALIAYYGFFSLFPALLALVTILHFVLENNASLRDDIANSALAQFPIIGEEISSSLSQPISGSTIALVIGLAGAIWAGMGMVQACQDAMNQAWAVERADYPNFFIKRLRSLIMLLLMVVLLVLSTGLAQLISILGLGVVGVVLLFFATIALNIAVFMVAFRVLTVADVSWRDVFFGAVFSGIAYTLLQYLGNIYVTRTLQGATETYGTFAVVIGLLSWIFLIAQVMMFGTEINTVRLKRLWPRSLFGRPATPGDRRSHAEQATAQKMDDTMDVDVDFQG
jgi:membrane protein